MSTADIDSLTMLTDELRAVVQLIADRHELRSDWLNDSASAFAPVGLDPDECEEHDPYLIDYVQQIADQSA